MARDVSPLWPARLHHIMITSDRPPELVDFYQRAMDMESEQIAPDTWRLNGGERTVLIGQGARNGLGFSAFTLDDPERVAALEDHVKSRGLEPIPSPTRLFGEGAFAVTDPDGHTLVFGTPEKDMAEGSSRLPARVQHSVVGTPNMEALIDFRLKLGFLISDEVTDEDGTMTAAFLRSDEEHHSQAMFRTKAPKFDHFSMETTCWNDIRDWADHLGAMRIPLSWGPGRHGPGNNLFFMVADSDGNMVELSAEIEHLDQAAPARHWKHEPHTLNLWGVAWMRN